MNHIISLIAYKSFLIWVVKNKNQQIFIEALKIYIFLILRKKDFVKENV